MGSGHDLLLLLLRERKAPLVTAATDVAQPAVRGLVMLVHRISRFGMLVGFLPSYLTILSSPPSFRVFA